MGRRPKNELERLARAARAQLALAEQLGESLKLRMQVKKDVAGTQGWIPDEDWRRDFNSVTTTIQHAGNSLIRAHEGNKRNLGGKSEEELEQQVKDQLAENAAVIPDDVWQEMIARRMKAGK